MSQLLPECLGPYTCTGYCRVEISVFLFKLPKCRSRNLLVLFLPTSLHKVEYGRFNAMQACPIT